MSAQIPDSMLLKDLLKATGYDCPDALKAKTFKEATAGDTPADLEDNHEVTVDVYTYTQPVEVTPASGKEGMKKCTITLENIPPSKLFAYGTAEKTVYLSFLPEYDIDNLVILVPSTTSLAIEIGSYTKEDDKVTLGSTDYARYTAGDIEL